MDIKDLLLADLKKKNRLITIIIVIATTLGLIFNIILTSHPVVPITLGVINVVIVSVYFAQKRLPMLRTVFPYLSVFAIATIAISSLIFDVAKVGAIGVVFLALVAAAIHTRMPVFIFGYVITLGIIVTVGLKGEGTLVVSFTNVYLLHLLSSIVLFSLIRSTNHVHNEANALMNAANARANDDEQHYEPNELARIKCLD